MKINKYYVKKMKSKRFIMNWKREKFVTESLKQNEKNVQVGRLSIKGSIVSEFNLRKKCGKVEKKIRKLMMYK